MIPLSVFPFPSAPCHKRVVSYPIIAFCCRSFNLSIAALPWGRFSFVQPLSLLRRQGRVAAPSVCFAVACILLAAAPTAPPCFRRWRRSSPLPLVGEPLAKRLTFPICQSLPSIGEVASRSDDGEVFPYIKRGPDVFVRPSLRSVLIPPWSRALPQPPALQQVLQPVLRALLLRGQQASPRASGDTDRPSAGRG